MKLIATLLPANRRKYSVLFLLMWLAALLPAHGQGITMSGQLLSKSDRSPMIGAGVVLISLRDTNQLKETSADVNGRFQFRNVDAGDYKLKAVYLGFTNFELKVTATGTNQDLGTLSMEETSVKLKTVTINETAVRSVQKNDTTEYNANAFKTQPDANAQDLVTKMPGITLENGAVKAQGENVQKVLIDGKEFFGDDATLALKNLPAEVIDKIQVFDRMSDQAQFTRFDDGNSQKTINIVTKGGKSNGQFGKVFAGYGTDDRYTAGGNVNLFSGKRRISIIGLSNNINQQNFASQDLLGISSGGGGRGPGGGGPGGRGGGPGGWMGGPGGGQGGASNFLVGQQGGINTTHSIGLNYSDAWGKKVNVTASYFFNEAVNGTTSDVKRTYFLGNATQQFYNQSSDATSDNMNHRFSMRFEYNPDTSNALILSPRLSFQDNSSGSTVTGITSLDSNVLLNQSRNRNSAQNDGYSFNNNLLYRHKFFKPGRTVSLNIGTDVNHKTGESFLNAVNEYFIPTDSAAAFDQRTATKTDGYTLSSGLIYTEPLGEHSQLMFSYMPSYTHNLNDKETDTKDSTTQEYSNLNTVLSNKFDNTVNTQRGGLGYRYGNDRVNFMLSANYQWVELQGSQTFPASFQVDKTFRNLMPMAMYSYKFSRNSNLRMFYRTSTNAPSVSQLQNVVDNSNPLLLSTGNPNLRQEYSHMFITRYNLANPDKGRTFFWLFNTTYTSNYIGNSTQIFNGNSISLDGVILRSGAQLTQPVNLEGYWNASSFITYGLPVKLVKSNLNLNAGVTYNRTPSLINNAENDANTYALNGGVVLSSNISDQVDFTVSYSGYYNIVKNSIQAQLNNNYFYQLTSAKLNLMPWKGLVIGTDVTHTYYTGLSSSYNLNFVLWNAGIGYKFLKNRAADIRLNAFDLLNQNNSISRTVTGTYVEDAKTQVLRQYFMLVFTYNIRNFKTGPAGGGNGPGPAPEPGMGPGPR